ncbi:DEAD/DEAH box helicase [Bifidobacterium pullorum subsp. saeculare]|uniref:DEAD/DEAH box helicase n=1 Tax=Bifidobacterium pullorum subsp. saeculare TaxID=78257 RepID=A0A938WXP9_9BIFI|nr:DEAD/DEAH box helicase [Bifidobacterium pullorum]MBM6699480.1 DEAD/DEAH box helicase [Bifidobacterium pullorum subsp. saeculare]
MCDSLGFLSAPAKAWFAHAFGRPTAVQEQAWHAIHDGRDVLAIAPTGSGKTLAAFLAAIDRLMAMPARERARRGVRVLYVSPLKALAVDVARNLTAPLDGIAAAYRAQGLAAPAIEVAIRSGDTTAKERRHIAAHPPHILVTTPESLYLMLTSKARDTLRTVDTVILDEVHAVAGSKRGAHLALSLERLDALAGRHAQRIGLSATVRPVDEAARFLAGGCPVTVVNPGGAPAMDLRIVEPLADMRDLDAANVPRRAGGVDAEEAGRPISGVTPAMRRLARRKGLAGSDADGTGHPAIVGAAGDGMDGMGTAPRDAVGSIWPVVERSVLDAVLAHHTTLVFVNSRGLAEKLTARLNDLAAGRPTGPGGEAPASPEGREGHARHYDAVVGSTTMLVGPRSADPDAVIAMAHHGSVSKDRRARIEQELKHGRLRCVVATSSLELGIDMGSVDLVIQIAPPLSVASGLQRVGRADHHVGGVSHALVYPLTRQQIIGAAASVEAMRAGAIEPLAIPRNPLDILAQQTVAAAAMEDLDADAWYAEVRRAAPFATLTRADYDATIGMLTGAYDAEEFSAFRPPLMRNESTGAIAARPGAQRLAVTSGGTIPDRGLYTVVLPESDAGRGPRRVGELDEEMVYESRVGDVITLGTSTWKIQEITRDRVVVVPAPGRTARLPFWHGDGAGRDAGFGRAIGRFLADMDAGLRPAAPKPAAGGEAGEQARPRPRFDGPTAARLAADGLDANAIGNLAGLLAEQRAATGAIPTDRRLVVERCPDEEGDWRVILHSPYGRRVHEPWAMALDHRLKQRYGFDGQTYAADDGIVIRLPDGVIPTDAALRDLFLFDPDDLMRDVQAQVGQTVLFAARFRECAARSLFMPRVQPGRRVPLWQQRLRAAQLLAAARTWRNFPLLLETARECLQDVYDLEALRRLMADLDAGTTALDVAATDVPSPLAENLLFGYVGQVMYQYDVPQAERNAQLLAIDPEVLGRLLGTADMAGVLDPAAIAEVERELAGRTFWNALADDDVTGRLARYAKTHGPFTADQAMRELGLDAAVTVRTLEELAARGDLLHGHFADLPGATEDQWLHRDVFRRIRSRSLARARAAIRPVDPGDYQRFLLRRQGVGSGGAGGHEGTDGLLRVIEQLEGVALPPTVWEHGVFPARVRGYAPALLDELLASGDVVWVGSGGAKTGEPGLVAFHPADSALLGAMAAHADRSRHEAARQAAAGTATLPDAILGVLGQGGAWRFDQLAALVRRRLETAGGGDGDVDPDTGEILPRGFSPRQCEEALWSLVWRGLVTNASFAPVRALGEGPRRRGPARTPRRRIRMPLPAPATTGGLWTAVAASTEPGGRDAGTAAVTPEEALLARVEALLDRYGVIAKPLVEQEGVPGGFAGLYPALRRMEEHGTLVRGMFVRGFGAAQFAAKDTVDALRRIASDKAASDGSPAVALDALDPADLAGAAMPWPAVPRGAAKPSRRAGAIVALVDGRPVLAASATGRHLTVFDADAHPDPRLEAACAALAQALRRMRPGSVSIADVNGVPATAREPHAAALRAAGFTPTPQGMTLYR